LNIYALSEAQLLVFALVLMRISAFFVAFPLVESANIPTNIKILLSMAVSIVVYPVVSARGVPSDILSGSIFLLVIKEVFMGLFVGFIAKFFFQALTICGDIVTMSIGLSSDQFFNPHMDRRVTVIEQYELLIGGLFFLAFNGHHLFIQGLMQSFDIIPVAKTSLQFATFRDITLFCQEIMSLGIKLAAPVLGAIFITNMAMGIVGRAVPQINVLVTSWPVNIMLGIAVLFVSLPLFMLTLKENLNWNVETLFEILKKL